MTLLLHRYHGLGEDLPTATSIGLVFSCIAHTAPTLEPAIGKRGIMSFSRIQNTKQLEPRHLV